jgi:hypothetical protein
MGASNWHHFTEYRPDPGEALRRLRQEVFAAGRYQCPAVAPLDRIRRLYQDAGAGADSPECREALVRHEAMRRALETGSEADLRRLSRSDRAVVRRTRVFQQMVGAFGAPPRPPGRQPRTIEELLDQAAESGTHSVLDITRTAARRGDGAAAPLPGRELRQIFGTERPTREQVEERVEDVWERLSPWQAYYVVTHRDGRPEGYAFVGCSGD